MDDADATPSHAGPADVDVRTATTQLRRSVTRIVRQLDTAARNRAARDACAHVEQLRSVRLARTVALYRAVDHELDCAALEATLAARGVRVLLAQPLDDRLVLTDAHEPRLRVAHPVGASGPSADGVAVEVVDVIVVPGAAFDLHGARLGRGDGHFNDLLARMPETTVRIGLAHGVQLVTKVPRNEHDELMDVIVSNHGVHHSQARTSPRDA